jgi:hypothetical protein
MPPDDGEDMAPTKRVDDPGHDDGVSVRDERRTTRTDSGLAGSTMLDDALRSGSTTLDREGGRYLGIRQKRPLRPMHRNPEEHPASSRDSPAAPNKQGAAQRVQIWANSLFRWSLVR